MAIHFKGYGNQLRYPPDKVFIKKITLSIF